MLTKFFFNEFIAPFLKSTFCEFHDIPFMNPVNSVTTPINCILKSCSLKALGTGFRKGVFWRDIGVVNLPGGKPTMRLTGGALARLNDILPDGMGAQIDLTITDEPPIAEALVIISTVPRSGS